MNRSLLFVAGILITHGVWAAGKSMGQPYNWGDQGNGTYLNPIVPADYSDPDVIRVGEDFYLISSTINMSPGMVVLHSRDLVNWRTIGHVVDDISKLGSALNWNRMGSYGKGIYAGSIRYHGGLYFVHFTSFEEGLFVGTARDPAGPWTVRPMKDFKGRALLAPKWDDPCPFWDDDGQAYLVASKPGGAWYPHLFRMSADGSTLLDADLDAMSLAGPQPVGQGTPIYPRESAEGNKIYKQNGFYYFFNNEAAWKGRVGMIRRSRFIYGERADGTRGTAAEPGAYQIRQMLVATQVNREINQGGLIDTLDGRWYFLTHGGAGGHADGRVLSLLPVVWKDGWPEAGATTGPGVPGDLVPGGPMPVRSKEIRRPVGSDDFNSRRLSPQWQWNHQPRADKWSLSERKGWLRLHAFPPLRQGDFFTAGNTVGVRYFSGQPLVATFKLDVSKIAIGQKAGIAHFNGGRNYGALSVSRGKTSFRVSCEEDGKSTDAIELPGTTRDLWLRTRVDDKQSATFEYSVNGDGYRGLESHYTLKWGGYRGNNIGLFTYNDGGADGHVDIDSFTHSFDVKQ